MRNLFYVLLLTAGLGAASTVFGQNMAVYDDALENGWQSFGWATLNFSNTTPVHTGSDSIKVVDSTTSYQALYLGHSAMSTASYQSLSFWVYPKAAGTNALYVQATLSGTAQPGQSISFTAGQVNAWQQVTINLSALGVASKTNFDGFWIQNNTGGPLTFYVDDISLIAAAPPPNIQLTVTPQAVVRTIDGRIYGVNTAIWDSQLATTANSTLLSALRTSVFRYPGGSASDNYDWFTNQNVVNGGFQWASSPATFATMASELGAQAYITINYGSGTPQEAAAWVAYYNGSTTNDTSLGTDSKGRSWRTVNFWANLRASPPLTTGDDGFNFLRISHPAPFGFLYWELGNECYGSWEYDQHGVANSGLSGAANDPYTYANAFVSFKSQMKAVAPNIKVGIVAAPGEDAYGNGTHGAVNPNEGNTVHTGWTAVVLSTLAAQSVMPDFIVDHIYTQNPGSESDSFLLQSGSVTAADATNIRKMVTDYVGPTSGAGIELVVTELNSVSFNPGKQSVSLVNGLFMADALGQLAGTEFNACTWWDLRNGSDSTQNNSANIYGSRQFGDYGILATGDRGDTPLNTAYPTYYAAQLLTHWGRGGDSVVSATSNYNLLSCYGTKLANGNVAVLVINKYPTTDLSAQVTLAGFTPGTSTATAYFYGKPNDTTNAGLSSTTFNPDTGTFTYVFPSYSMTVLTITGQWQAWRQQNFNTSQLANTSVSGDTASPAQDGVPNLMKYALGLPAMIPASSSSLATTGTATPGGSKHLTLNFTQNSSLTDVTYTVQVSSDLKNWNSGAGYTQRIDNGTTNQAVYEDLSPISSTPRHFMRLMVTRH